MEPLNFFYQVAVIALAGMIIVGFAYYLVKKHIDGYLKFKTRGDVEKNHGQLVNLRLQAYERLLVFVERLNPSNILIRLHQPGSPVSVMQSAVINEINAEYQHNVAQQLYVKKATWDVVRKLKDDTLAMIANAARGLPEEASGTDLSKKVLQHIGSMTQNPYDLTLDLIKKDIHQQF